MSDSDRQSLDERVLVLAPTARDGSVARDIFASAGITCCRCLTIEEVCREAERGAGAAIVPAEALLVGAESDVAGWLKSQPPWSDFPLIVLTPPRLPSLKYMQGLQAIGNMTLMQRPLQVSSLLSTVQSCLRDRRRQYNVRDLLAERERTAEALRDSDRKKDDFIALLAHELRNPLAPIRYGLQIMRLADGDANAAASARAMMERQLAHMVRLIDDLLDISRINRNKMELRRSRILLSDVVNNAVETARPAIDEARHELIVSLPPEPIFLDADLTRLAQVFSNLLSNSTKYTRRGGRIWLTARTRNDAVVVTVRDTGIGIPRDNLASIFNMFSQVDRSVERAAGGLGIGLALVKGLVEMHGGTVSASSEGQGSGSTFSVTLPVGDRFETPPYDVNSDDGPDAIRGHPRRVLVVDDNRDSADSMAMMLKLLGHEVLTADNGLAGIRSARQFRPDVILMDLGMPQLNGLDATRQIRAEPWGRNIIIIALTGWGQENNHERSLKAGCDAHLVKPVNLADLQKLLSELAG